MFNREPLPKRMIFQHSSHTLRGTNYPACQELSWLSCHQFCVSGNPQVPGKQLVTPTSALRATHVGRGLVGARADGGRCMSRRPVTPSLSLCILPPTVHVIEFVPPIENALSLLPSAKREALALLSPWHHSYSRKARCVCVCV